MYAPINTRITADQVRNLREKSGYGMITCRDSLYYRELLKEVELIEDPRMRDVLKTMMTLLNFTRFDDDRFHAVSEVESDG